MTIYRSDRSAIRVWRIALLVSLAAPVMASADDSFSGTVDDEHANSWRELSRMDHHALRDARLADKHADWPKGLYAHGRKAGEIKRGPHGHAPSIASPVPEPTTWAMMLLGLGVVGLWARRRT